MTEPFSPITLLIGGTIHVYDVRHILLDSYHPPAPKPQTWDRTVIHHTADRGMILLDPLEDPFRGSFWDELRYLTQGAYQQSLGSGGRLGWPYNFTIFPSGRIFYTGDIDQSRPHTYNANDEIAIALQGHFHEPHEETPTEAAEASLRELVDALPRIWGTHQRPVCGHRGVPGGRATACPGDILMELVTSLNS